MGAVALTVRGFSVSPRDADDLTMDDPNPSILMPFPLASIAKKLPAGCKLRVRIAGAPGEKVAAVGSRKLPFVQGSDTRPSVEPGTADLILDPAELERWRARRRYRVEAIQIPFTRLIGFTLLTLALCAHNRYILESFDGRSEWNYARAVWLYSLASWALIAGLHRTRPWISDFFLAIDLVPMVTSVYLSGVDRSWMYPVILLRVADQAGTTVRRVLSYGSLGVILHLAMVCWAWEGGHPIRWVPELVKAGLLSGGVLYVSLTTLSVERLRSRVKGAIRVARASLLDLHQHLRRSELMEEELRLLSNRLQSAQEEERTRIARELHDELGQTLTVLKSDASWLEEQLADDERLGRRVANMILHIEGTLQTVRVLSTRLRPQILDDFGLTAGIEWLARELCRGTAMRYRLTSELDERDLDPECTTALFRICQEALTNAVRHSGGDHVTIRLTREGSEIVARIEDNGKGLPPAECRRSHSLGLLGIRERARALGGTIQLDGAPGKGASVTVRLPAERRAQG
ncbi:MAG: sensor histidine kinase [Armatimonadetes bacterium]|nr:sensor histidine kinase [Armatimonadota bacterium]